MWLQSRPRRLFAAPNGRACRLACWKSQREKRRSRGTRPAARHCCACDRPPLPPSASVADLHAQLGCVLSLMPAPASRLPQVRQHAGATGVLGAVRPPAIERHPWRTGGIVSRGTGLPCRAAWPCWGGATDLPVLAFIWCQTSVLTPAMLESYLTCPQVPGQHGTKDQRHERRQDTGQHPCRQHVRHLS